MEPELSVDEIQSLRASLDGSERETQRFLDHVVHDLRSAQRSVGISSEVLLARFSSLPEEGLQKSARHLQEGLARMDAILSGISNYSLSLRASAY